jgi:hypothetical protein
MSALRFDGSKRDGVHLDFLVHPDINDGDPVPVGGVFEADDELETALRLYYRLVKVSQKPEEAEAQEPSQPEQNNELSAQSADRGTGDAAGSAKLPTVDQVRKGR